MDNYWIFAMFNDYIVTVNMLGKECLIILWVSTPLKIAYLSLI